jgi:hypothetical protein
VAAVVEEVKTGATASGSSVTVTFDTAPAAGETVVLAVGMGSNVDARTPAGFNRVRIRDQTGVDVFLFSKVAKTGASAAYTILFGSTAGGAVVGMVVSGLNGDRPWDVGADDGTDSNVTSQVTGTTATTQDADSFLVSVVGVRSNSPGTVSWTSATAQGQVATGGSGSDVGTVAVGTRSVTSTGTQSDTASWSTGNRAAALIVAFRESEGPPTDAYRDEIMADSPSEYWRMGDPVSPPWVAAWNDAVSGTSLKANGAPTFGATSLLSQVSDTALTFDGTDDELTDEGVPSTPVAGLDGDYVGVGSVEFWTQANASRDASDTLIAVGFTYSGLVAWQYDASGFYQLHWRDDTGSGQSAQMWNPTTGDVDHVVVVTDATSMRIYRNGDLYETITTNAQTEQDHRWCSMGRNKGGTAWWTGTADEVALYRTALTQTRIQAHYDAAESSVAFRGLIIGSPPFGT